MLPQGEAANPDAGCVERRVGQRRGHRRHGGFPHSAEFRAAFEDRHGNFRRIRLAGNRVIVEIALVHPSVGERDALAQCGGESETQSALHLCPHGVRIDDTPAVDHAPCPERLELAFRRNPDFHDLADDALEGLVQREAASVSSRSSVSTACCTRCSSARACSSSPVEFMSNSCRINVELNRIEIELNRTVVELRRVHLLTNMTIKSH